MAIKVIAQRREVKLGKNPGMKFVMRHDLYIPIQEKKVEDGIFYAELLWKKVEKRKNIRNFAE